MQTLALSTLTAVSPLDVQWGPLVGLYSLWLFGALAIFGLYLFARYLERQFHPDDLAH